MVDVRTARLESPDHRTHPAVIAWKKIQSLPLEPVRIEILKGRSPRLPNKLKRLVCRLVYLDSAEASVIGKRCRHVNALVENTIYEKVIPFLKITSLKYYGMVEDTDEKYSWIFMEDAGDETYSEFVLKHRKLAARWLSKMHTSAGEAIDPTLLPDRSHKHYLERLKSSREAILFHIDNNKDGINGSRIFETIISHFEVLEKSWDKVEEICDGLPQTLVHGDFVAKNIRVRQDASGIALLPFDWGEAGWGIPATDIRDIDISEYWMTVRNFWPWLNLQLLQQLSTLGEVFHYIDAIRWEIPGLRRAWWKDTLDNWKIYESRLANGMLVAGLDN